MRVVVRLDITICLPSGLKLAFVVENISLSKLNVLILLPEISQR